MDCLFFLVDLHSSYQYKVIAEKRGSVAGGSAPVSGHLPRLPGDLLERAVAAAAAAAAAAGAAGAAAAARYLLRGH